MKRKLRISVLLLAAINSSLAISHPDTTLAPESVTTLIVVFNYILLLFSLILADRKMSDRKGLIMAVVVLWFLVRVTNVASNATIQLQGGTLLLLLVFSMLPEPDMAAMMKWYRNFLIIVSSISLVVAVDYVLGLGLPHTITPFYEDNMGVYIDYKISYIHLEKMLRLCGVFNEPGYFGTFLGLVLVMEHFNLRKPGNILLIVAGVLTFSLAFFVILIIGVLLYIRNRKTLMYVVLLVLTLFVILPYVAERSEQVDSILTRLEFDKATNKIVGDNRTTSEFDIIERDFYNSGNLIWGYGTGYVKSFHLKNVSSYKIPLVEWGFLGFILTYGLLIFCAIKNSRKRRDAIVYVLCFAASIYQRPNVFALDYFLLLFGGIHYIRYYVQNTVKPAKLRV